MDAAPVTLPASVTPRDKAITFDDAATWTAVRAPSTVSVFDHLSGLLLLAATVVVLLTFRDYGITHDEEVQAIYGERLLSYYTSLFADRSAFTYLDLYWYGGLFDLVAAILNKVSPFGYYETRHLLGGLVGVLGLTGAWRMGRLAGGPRVGFLATLLLALTPAFHGHSFNNPKDAPFAVAMLWLVYCVALLVRELPRPSWPTLVKLGVALGLALSIRVGALLAVGYLGVVVCVHLGRVGLTLGLLEARCRATVILLKLLAAGGIAYAIVAVFWPWGVLDPLNPLRALQHFSRYDIPIETLYAGVKLTAQSLPADYIVGYLAVTMPELVLAGLAALAASLVVNRKEGRVPLALAALAVLFPIGFFVVFRPTAYDGLRHFLFVVPPLVVLAAAGLGRMWAWVERSSPGAGRGFGAVLAAAVVVQGWVIVRLHPDEYIYYNVFAGGVAGAEGRWELDYWSNSFHEAADKLAEIVRMENGGIAPAGRVVKVGICGNDLSAGYFFPPYLQLTPSIEEADFIIAFTQSDCWKTWRGRPVAEVERFGAVLAMVKDRRGLPNPEQE